MPAMLTQINLDPTGRSGVRNKPKWYRSPKAIRHAVMAFFFGLLVVIAYQHQVHGGGPRGTPSIEAFCPFGGVESLYQFATTGGYIRRIEPSSMVLFAAVVVLTLLFSRGFCGWICPFGAVQEWIGLLGRKLFGKQFNPGGRLDSALRYLKYVLLAVIIGLTWQTGSLVFRDYDPFLAFFHLGEGVNELPWAYGILAVVLAGSLYIERFFCKYACPLGAVLGVLGKVGLTRIERDPVGCKECNLCQKKCHAHVDFLSGTTIRSAECNHCLDCVEDCPKPNVLSATGPKWRFSHPVYAAGVVGGLFLMIGAGQLSGKWQSKPADVKLTNSTGKLDAENIRGWMTLDEISKGYGVPMERLYAGTGLPRTVPSNERLNTIGKTHKLEFEPDKVREVVRNHLDGKPAAKKGDGKGKNSGGKEHSGGEEPEIKGMMTLNEIALKTGAPKEYFIRTLGLPKEINATVPVREWMHDHGKSIQDLRDALKAYRAGKR